MPNLQIALKAILTSPGRLGQEPVQNIHFTAIA